MSCDYLDRVYVIIDFYIFETFIQIKSKQKRKKIQKRKEIANHLQRMHEIISALNWQTTIVLRGKFSTKCASYQTAKITM